MVTFPWWGLVIQTITLLVSGGVLVWLLGELKERINRPKVLVQFDLAPDCVIECPLRREYEKITRATYVRIRIKNSGNVGINNCQAWITGIQRYTNGLYKESEYQESLPIVWSYMPELETMHIPPGVTMHADVFIFHTCNPPNIQFRSPSGEVLRLDLYEKLFTEEGRFRYRVVVSGDGMTPEGTDVEYEFADGRTHLYRGPKSMELVRPTLEDFYAAYPKLIERDARERAYREKRAKEIQEAIEVSRAPKVKSKVEGDAT